MRSISHLVVHTNLRPAEGRRKTGPVACALFITVVAMGVTGGALWLTSAVVHSNARTASMILSYEQ
jgi:hypothetical protein